MYISYENCLARIVVLKVCEIIIFIDINKIIALNMSQGQPRFGGVCHLTLRKSVKS